MTLLLRLKDYRQFRSTMERVPIYCVFGDTVLHSIATARPVSLQALSGIRGFTQEKRDQYGGDILRLVQSALSDHSDHTPPPTSPDRCFFSSGGKKSSYHQSGSGGKRKLLQKAFASSTKGRKRPAEAPSTSPPPSGSTHFHPYTLSKPCHGEGIYVLELALGRVYVGRTSDWNRRLSQHMSGRGSAFTQAFPPTGTVLPRLGCVSGSLEAAERDETLRYMFLRGIDMVRGWKYTRVQMSEEEEQDAEENIRELFDLCRRCGHPGHFVSQCKACFDRLGKACKF